MLAVRLSGRGRGNMHCRVMIEDYHAENLVGGSMGDNQITGTVNARFNEWSVGYRVWIDGIGFAGYITNIVSAAVIEIDRALEQNFSDKKIYVEATSFLSNLGAITKRLESDEFGRAGMVVYDDASLSFMGTDLQALEYEDMYTGLMPNPVRELLLAGDMNAKRRYLVHIFAVGNIYGDESATMATDGGDELTDGTDLIVANWKRETLRRVFVGMVDFQSIERRAVVIDGVELIRDISFTAKDKLSALQLIVREAGREYQAVKPGLIPALNVNNLMKLLNLGGGKVLYFLAEEIADPYSIAIEPELDNSMVFNVGDVIEDLTVGGVSYGAGIVLNRKIIPDVNYSNNWRCYMEILAEDPTAFSGAAAETNGPWEDVPYTSMYDVEACKFYSRDFRGVDVYLYENKSRTIVLYDRTVTETLNTIVALDGIKLVEAFIKRLWPDAVLLAKMVDSDGVAMSEYRLPVQYSFLLNMEFPFDEEPYVALKRIIQSMGAYLFVDADGKFVLMNRNALALPEVGGIGEIELGAGLIGEVTVKSFWDKVVDCVTVTVKSFKKLPDDSDYYIGTGSAYKVIGVKARNTLELDIMLDLLTLDEYGIGMADDGTLNMGEETDQNVILNYYAETKAAEVLAYYGSRRENVQVPLVGLTWEMLLWGLDIYTFLSAQWLAARLQVDLWQEAGELELVAVEGTEYNSETVIIGNIEERI
jgi:hypothetical protein